MDNNSININKTNNHFYTASNTNNTTPYDVGNPDDGLEQAHKCGGVNPIKLIPNLFFC
jgi:hypothetical protein